VTGCCNDTVHENETTHVEPSVNRQQVDSSTNVYFVY